MKITPIEIRQKVFEKKIRGYDKDEVNAFLQSLSNEWERVLDENKEYKIKLDQAEKEVQKLREVENSLFKTLKTAEDTGANLVEQANKAAELHLKETQMNAEGLMRESKSKASAIIEQAEVQAKEMIDEMQEALKDLEKNYRSLENQRDNLLGELKILSADIMERLDRSTRQSGPFKVEDHMKRVKSMVRESEQRIKDQKLEIDPLPAEKIPSLEPGDTNSSQKLEAFLKSKESLDTPRRNTPKESTPPPVTPEPVQEVWHEPTLRQEEPQPTDPVEEKRPTPPVSQKPIVAEKPDHSAISPEIPSAEPSQPTVAQVIPVEKPVSLSSETSEVPPVAKEPVLEARRKPITPEVKNGDAATKTTLRVKKTTLPPAEPDEEEQGGSFFDSL